MSETQKFEPCENYAVDVKLVQALLKKIGYWQDEVDGAFTIKFAMAITYFQSKFDLAETGNILPDGKDIELLSDKTGGDYMRLTSNVALDAVYVEPIDKPHVKFAAKDIKWPKDSADKILTFCKAFTGKHKIALSLDLISEHISDNGEVEYDLITPDILWLNSRGEMHSAWPQELTDALSRSLDEAGFTVTAHNTTLTLKQPRLGQTHKET